MFTGWICKQSIWAVSVDTFWTTATDTTYFDEHVTMSPKDCHRMITTKQCDGRSTVQDATGLWGYNGLPTPQWRWLRTAVTPERQCQFENINLE